MSADGEQVEDDADRIHKRADDLEQFTRDTLLGAKGSRNNHRLPYINCLRPASWRLQIYLSNASLIVSVIRIHCIILNVRDPCGKLKLLL